MWKKRQEKSKKVLTILIRCARLDTERLEQKNHFMGELRIEVEYFKDGLPTEDGDYNEYGARNYKNAVYTADVALEDGVADEVVFYVGVDDEEPTMLSYNKNTFDVEEVSKKLDSVISHIGD